MSEAMKRLGIKEIPQAQRPRERWLAVGAAGVSDAELLAILLRTGYARGESALDVAQALLFRLGEDGVRRLEGMSVEELSRVPGIGRIKALEIKAAVELGRRVLSSRQPGASIQGPQDVAAILQPEMSSLPQEEFRALLLNTRHRLITTIGVSRGTLDSSPAAPREVFREAVARAAAAVIVAHNHPSGEPEPSPDDIAVTKRLVSAGSLLGIDVLDHLIIGDNCYVSLRERGVL